MKTLHEACVVINWGLAVFFVTIDQPAFTAFAMGNAILNCIFAGSHK